MILKTLWLPGILLFCSIALPWYVAVQLHNPQFFREFILEHNLARFSKNLYHHTEPFWYYLPVVALALLPWTMFVIGELTRLVRIWRVENQSARTQKRSRLSIRAVCMLLADCAGSVFLHLAIQTPRLHSSCASCGGLAFSRISQAYI